MAAGGGVCCASHHSLFIHSFIYLLNKAIQRCAAKCTIEQDSKAKAQKKPQLSRNYLLRLIFLQGVSTACYEEPCVSYGGVVHLSITCWHCVKTTQARITKSSPMEKSKDSSLGDKKYIKNEGIKWEWGRKNLQFSANKLPYLRDSARQNQGYH